MSFSVSRFHRALAVFLLALAGTALAAPTFTPFDPSGLYAPGEKVGWTVTFSADDTQSYTYQIKKNNFTPLASGTLDPAAGTATLETVLDEPAMVYVEITPTYAPADTPPLALGAAIAPEQIAPAEPPPDDFDAFWREKIAQLHEIPADPQLIPGDSGVEGVEYATLRMNNIAGAHIYGQLAKPSKPGKYPALLILQWAGGPYPLQKSWVTEPAAEGWLALNIEPHDVPGDMPPEFYAALPALLRRYNTIYDDDRDRNYFLQMYLGAYRAADYLAQHPDWNGEVFLRPRHPSTRAATQRARPRRPALEAHPRDRARSRRSRRQRQPPRPHRRLPQLEQPQPRRRAHCPLFRHRLFRLAHPGPRTRFDGFPGYDLPSGRDLGRVQPNSRAEGGRPSPRSRPQPPGHARTTTGVHRSRKRLAHRPRARRRAPARFRSIPPH